MHRGRGNALRGATATILRGLEKLEVFGTRVGPLGLLQPNPEAAERIYDELVDGIDGGRVLDLYAGSGATTRRLAGRAGELLRLGPRRIHVMSCGPAGLARDIAALAPAYRVESLRAYDTLPQTPHVKLIVKLLRVDEAIRS